VTLQNLLDQKELREKQTDIMDLAVASEVLMEFFDTCSKDISSYIDTGNYIEDLLENYFLFKNTSVGESLEKIMKQYNFNYTNSIHNAIYYLLGREWDLVGRNTNPTLWPGITQILAIGPNYRLDTNLGIIKVSKASDIFKNTDSSYIFDRELMMRCYSRSYEFIEKNRDQYKVVLSYLPNFFRGGHYHAYLENDSSILDIAANSIYLNKEEAKNVLTGNVICKISYDEVEERYKDIEREIPDINNLNSSRLHTLALYYDYKNMK